MFALEEIHFEGQDAEEFVHVAANAADTILFPCPYLGCDSASVIIDVPENITFETTLPVYENGTFRSFSGRAGLETFSDPLRKIRIFVDPSVADKAWSLQWN